MLLKVSVCEWDFKGDIETKIPCRNIDDIWLVLSILKLLREGQRDIYFRGEKGHFTKVG